MDIKVKQSYDIVMDLSIIYLLLPISLYCNSELLNEAQIYESKELLPRLFDPVPLPGAGTMPLLNRKIFRGRRVSIREHPYIASIRRNVAHYCVGAIVTKNVLVTVAHPLINYGENTAELDAFTLFGITQGNQIICICSVSIAELSVVVGENYADRGSMLLTVILIIVHQDFNPSTLENDVALLRIFEDITYKGSAKSIPLIRVTRSLEGRRAFVTGWGRCDRTGRELCLPRSTRYTEGERFDPMLRTVYFTIREENSYCDVYNRNQMHLGPGMLCLGAAREENPVVTCSAVPGAPLVVGAHLAGILSWGFGCGHNTDLPLIYTSTQFYQQWLLHNIFKLRSISKVYLLKLFQAKRAYILEQWLLLTRILPPSLYSGIDRHMEPLRVDRELAKLSGTVYDIRDFLYDGIHHKYKMKLYKKLRESFLATTKKKNLKADEIRGYFKKRNDTIRPFLNVFNETYINIDDDSITDSGDMLGDNDSNEEYGVY